MVRLWIEANLEICLPSREAPLTLRRSHVAVSWYGSILGWQGSANKPACNGDQLSLIRPLT